MNKKEQARHSEETAESCYALGVQSYVDKDLPSALALLEKAINIDPQCHQAFALAGQVFLETDRQPQAIDCYACAIRAAPGQAEYKEKLVPLLAGFRFRAFSHDMQSVVLECLRVHGVDHQGMWQAWHSLLTCEPGFASLYRAADEKTYDDFKKRFSAAPSCEALLSDYFLTGLQKIIVPDLRFEKFLTWLRRFMLEEAGGATMDCFGEDLLPLAAALAVYCEHTEYIFYVSPEEHRAVDSLEHMLSADPAGAGPVAVAVYGCYRLLHALPVAAAIEKHYVSLPVMADLIRVQIMNYTALQEIRKTIPALTPIEDWVSGVVRDQYEQFPYPRRHEIAREIRSEHSEGPLRGQKANILVAGCGTGVEAIELARVFSDASVLAVDLSLTSLSYAVKQAQEYKLKNITFRQADILGLDTLGESFDYIAAPGVLHHMDDPLRGWQVLCGLLKPGGLMRIGIYSRTARESITAARAVIEEEGYGYAPADIRKFRNEAGRVLNGRIFDAVTRLRDYYSMSECRDLLFHVHEHCFDIPQISGALERLGLRFLEFQLGADILKKYDRKYPDDPERTNLDYWHAFEQKNPDTFIEMYRFWCRKK